MDSFEKEVHALARSAKGELRTAARKFTKGKKIAPITKTVRVKGREFKATEAKLIDSIEHKVDRRKGSIDRLQIRFAYHAFFLERGLGRGGLRKPKAFYTPVITKTVNTLADIASKDYADKAIKSIFI